ncbi:hypothetical protein FBF86_10165 [Serratia marcescens]|uniref:hypothetical protein n=1 Tax=Serratia marcescens TaxID=615 RepID=UPI001153A06E|nr:hypothetical protein [Serratia marcescens]QDI18312.1 hypothetical protein FBF86_10165 [Serratia marcescens]QDI28055.1 hypothetical protein FG169_10165 [Serratia marcescens]QDI42519.1 hypothetical protein FG172_10150 [Serratia marcescens]QDI56948.1 hypothetical protein FG175_10150 [Serratia marcescens]
MAKSKSQMKYANRAWRKATANWGMGKKTHRDFCRENAQVTVHEYCCRGGDFESQADAIINLQKNSRVGKGDCFFFSLRSEEGMPCPFGVVWCQHARRVRF